jgi:AcrR family transcriptional regulator
MARPREFDEQDVLHRALIVFWEKGYEGASLSDLAEATGLNKSSLYKAFVSKEELYRRVVNHYNLQYCEFQSLALSEETPRQIAEALLKGEAILLTGDNTPPGCLETNGALACSVESEDIRQELIAKRRRLQERLRIRFEATRKKGHLLPGATADETAEFVITLIQGMAVQAKAGATRAQLERFVELSLLSWLKDKPALRR